ncbi:hypothetical protein [Sphingorhabdus contaminans]|jgi:hypothetical protein|uniref:hypothetical protein n=1 Tax=Sphingorhabdus contaminans TaxID=1343899 RepID=UPI001476C825|nr:hypothetical protein [Sphingorhabdus contaminans]
MLTIRRFAAIGAPSQLTLHPGEAGVRPIQHVSRGTGNIVVSKLETVNVEAYKLEV